MSEDKVNHEQKVLPQRLLSYRGSRDLSLGSLNTRVGYPNSKDKSLKHFAPNVNVQRKKNQEIRVKEEFVKNERKNPRGSRGRGQGRGRHSTLVQASSSVFAEGIAATPVTNTRRSSSSYDSGNSKDGVLEIPKLNYKQNCKVNKDEEDRKLNELLRDNFIDNADLEPDPLFAPISLPLNSNRNHNSNKKINRDIKIKVEPKVNEEKMVIVGGVKIKQEIVETEGDEHSNFSDSVSGVPNCPIKQEPHEAEQDFSENLFQSLHIKDKTLFLIQLPDRLPALSIGSTEMEKTSNVKSKPGSGSNQESDDTKKYCRLSDLAPGHIGHLQVRRSGKVELVLGKCVLNVTLGTNVGFQQDLVAIQLDSDDQHTGESVALGPVTTRVICTPDWNSLLKCS